MYLNPESQVRGEKKRFASFKNLYFVLSLSVCDLWACADLDLIFSYSGPLPPPLF